MAHDCNYREEKLCDVNFKSRLYCIRIIIVILFSKLLDVSEVFWNFTCILKSKLLCTQSRWRAKYQTEMQSCIEKLSNSGQKVKLQVKFPVKKNTLTVDTNDRTFNCNNADWHSQTGNRKKLASRIHKTSWRTKATRSALRLCLHTVTY